MVTGDYNSELTYKVLYYSKGEGNVDLTTKKVAVALDSLMQIKRMIIAGFNVKEMIQNETIFSAITDAVEKTVHTESNADFRLGLTYGSEADYLYNQSTGQCPCYQLFLCRRRGYYQPFCRESCQNLLFGHNRRRQQLQ